MDGDGNTHQSKKTKFEDNVQQEINMISNNDDNNTEANMNPSTPSSSTATGRLDSSNNTQNENIEAPPFQEEPAEIQVQSSQEDDIQVFRRRIRNRNYRRSSNTSSADSFNNSNANEDAAISSDNDENEDGNDDEESNDDDSSSSSLSSDSDDYSPINSDFMASDNAYDTDNEGIELPFIETDTLKNKWPAYQELQNRAMGSASKQKNKYNPCLFQNRFYGSLYAVQKLSLLHKLNQHDGCVNSLNFNNSGKLLASGSDDLKIIIWDWKSKKVVKSIDSGHKSNVFQTKFIEDKDSKSISIVSTGRDGQVRHSHVRPCGTAETALLFKMSQSVHKIAVLPQKPREILAAGEDGVVRQFDLRTKTGTKIVKLKKRLYGIATHPFESEFCVSGSDKFVRVYDYRNTKRPHKQLCPEALQTNENGYQTVTCCVYNNSGSEILASYGDQDIFLFQNHHLCSENGRVLHSYSGHCNSKTIKGVNFFGLNSEYIVSGSDCGHIFFWDKQKETVAKWMKGDDTGVVNCLEPHPVFPILASSGLDNDVKIWIPKGDNDKDQDTTYSKQNLEKNVRRNLKLRKHPEENIFDDRILDFLIFHRLRNARRTRVLSRDLSSSDNSNEENDEDNDGNDENRRSLLQCNPS